MSKAAVKAETRVLVCEGVCNPTLLEYDQAAARAMTSTARDVRKVVGGWSRDLVHTEHVSSGPSVFSIRLGAFGPVWACSVCGHKREF